MQTAGYEGGQFISAHLIGIENEEGIIDMRYDQINAEEKMNSRK